MSGRSATVPAPLPWLTSLMLAAVMLLTLIEPAMALLLSLPSAISIETWPVPASITAAVPWALLPMLMVAMPASR